MKETQVIIRMEDCDKDYLKDEADSLCMTVSDLIRMYIKLGRAKLLELENQNKSLGLNAKEISVFAGKKSKQ